MRSIHRDENESRKNSWLYASFLLWYPSGPETLRIISLDKIVRHSSDSMTECHPFTLERSMDQLQYFQLFLIRSWHHLLFLKASLLHREQLPVSFVLTHWDSLPMTRTKKTIHILPISPCMHFSSSFEPFVSCVVDIVASSWHSSATWQVLLLSCYY